MDTEIVAPATPTEPASPIADPVETADDSIAAHEAQFGKGSSKTPAAEGEPTRHRAKSQQASAGDAPRIAELTKKWRDAERRAEEAERRATARIPDTDRRQETAIAETKTATAEKVSGKPSWETYEAQIGEKYPTWGAAQNAFADDHYQWRADEAKRERDEQQQSDSKKQSEQAVTQSYVTRAQAYGKTNPGFHDKMKAAEPLLDGIPDLLFQSLLRLDNGPQITEYLVDHPSDLDDMCLAADGKAVTDSSVALLQRRLSHYRTPAAPTASAAVVPPVRLAPKPPNAVRTGPLKTGDEPPGEDASIAEHEKHYGKRRR